MCAHILKPYPLKICEFTALCIIIVKSYTIYVLRVYAITCESPFFDPIEIIAWAHNDFMVVVDSELTRDIRERDKCVGVINCVKPRIVSLLVKLTECFSLLCVLVRHGHVVLIHWFHLAHLHLCAWELGVVERHRRLLYSKLSTKPGSIKL